jgi:beta-exotoxin I transport system permease protein
MSGTVFMETLRSKWRTMLYWGLGLAVYGFFITSFIQDANMLKQYSELVKTLPPAMMAMFGADAASMATPEGFLGLEFFSYSLLVTAIYAVMAGLDITANEEDAGIMDVLLSLPLARWRVIVEKFLAYTLMLVVVIGVMTLGLTIGNQASAIKIDSPKLLESGFNVLPGTLLMMAFTTFVAVLVRTKGTATGIAAVFVIGSYLLNSLGEAASGSIANQLRGISFFRYFDYNGVIQTGLNWGNIGLLLGVAVILFAGSLWLFDRRDVGI